MTDVVVRKKTAIVVETPRGLWELSPDLWLLWRCQQTEGVVDVDKVTLFYYGFRFSEFDERVKL